MTRSSGDVEAKRADAPDFAFASDNSSGICPEAWASMAEANRGHAPSYGEDGWTTRAADAIRALFACDCEVFFAYSGTAANSLALAALCQPYNGIICTDIAHIETDECGAPEFFSGAKILTAPAVEGKLTPDAVRHLAGRRRDVHYPKARAVSLSQSTETGRVYAPDEIAAVCAEARALGLRVHMDGSRFANACAALGRAPADLTWRAGVDVLCLGGAKNGMAVGEAIVFFDTALAADFEYRCKQAGQLAAKMRFMAAPWIGLIESGAWLRNARHANACAARFAAAVTSVPGVALVTPVEANAVFLKLDAALQAAMLAKGWRFYTFIGGGARFMFSWNADDGRIERLLADFAACAATLGSTA